jgi:methylated-DNA-protein-cysteine methyltransferase-like protein
MGKVFEKIYQEVKRIPKGKTATYGEIAKRVGTTPKIVGFALHKNPDPKNIPCHRVIFKDGSLSKSYAFGGIGEQRRRLIEEKCGIIKANGSSSSSQENDRRKEIRASPSSF